MQLRVRERRRRLVCPPDHQRGLAHPAVPDTTRIVTGPGVTTRPVTRRAARPPAQPTGR
jgi:hypothetical protein